MTRIEQCRCEICRPAKVLSKKEIAKRLLKSKSNTVFTNIKQIENTLNILKKMGVLKSNEN